MSTRENVFERVDRIIDLAVRHFKSGQGVLELPEDLANIFERWEMAYRITRRDYQRGKEYYTSVYSIWIKNRFGIIDLRTIREDLYAAPILFTKIEPTNREFKRMLSIERLEKSILKAEAAGQFAEQARLEAVLFKYLDPKYDPTQEQDLSEIANNFMIMPAFNPKLLGIEEPKSFEQVMKFKEKMILKKKKMVDEMDELEDERASNDE